VVLSVLAIGSAACSGTSPNGGPSGGSQLPATGTPAPASAASSARPSTAPATGGSGSNLAKVDLTFTGSRPFVASGQGGRCLLIKGPSGAVTSFGFEATDADFPGLGQSFSMAQFAGNPYVDIKWVIDGATAYARPLEGTITLSADGRGVTVDTDLAAMTSAGGVTPGPEHVQGTVVCP
jgi:hypothetical protein